MKIGDKVKFLSETGGGVVAGFQGKNIVLVEDEDGFQIPTPINEVVVIAQEDYSSQSHQPQIRSHGTEGCRESFAERPPFSESYVTGRSRRKHRPVCT